MYLCEHDGTLQNIRDLYQRITFGCDEILKPDHTNVW